MRKDPGATLDYIWDWSGWLQTGEVISSAVVTVPSGITLNSYSNTTTTVTAWLSGGTAGVEYAVKCKIVTNRYRTDYRSIIISVQVE